MRFLPATQPTLARNLALDEALLEAAEEADGRMGTDQSPANHDNEVLDRVELDKEVLRLWESPEYAVVVGRSSSISAEVNETECERLNIPIVRRCSGGTSVVIGPGCLMYALLLDHHRQPALRQLDFAHRYVMTRMQEACEAVGSNVRFQGTCDLTLNGKKFSGNSLRTKRSYTMYHGTMLYDFDLSMISRLLKTPPRQPDYRASRDHDAFVTNLDRSPDVSAESFAKMLEQAVRKSWQAEVELNSKPDAKEAELVQRRYGKREWHYLRP